MKLHSVRKGPRKDQLSDSRFLISASRRASQRAVKLSLQEGRSVTYEEDGVIYKVGPGNKKEVIDRANESPRKLNLREFLCHD